MMAASSCYSLSRVVVAVAAGAGGERWWGTLHHSRTSTGTTTTGQQQACLLTFLVVIQQVTGSRKAATFSILFSHTRHDRKSHKNYFSKTNFIIHSHNTTFATNYIFPKMAPKSENTFDNDVVIDESPEPQQQVPRVRSVGDFDSVCELTTALQEKINFDGLPTSVQDWELTQFDSPTSVAEPNNVHDEAKRLLCLKSYNILDSEQETEFEVITEEAKKVFDCPVAVVSFVDMGRQWFKSIQGLPGVEETPRCVAFCSHVVKQKDPFNVMVVPDATKDVRFQNNPLVTGGPMIRFYAGAALLTPEGERVGTLCVLDTTPHPEGLDEGEKQRLKTMAQEVVLQMIMRTEDE